MTLTIAGTTFEHHHYDRRRDRHDLPPEHLSAEALAPVLVAG